MYYNSVQRAQRDIRAHGERRSANRASWALQELQGDAGSTASGAVVVDESFNEAAHPISPEELVSAACRATARAPIDGHGGRGSATMSVLPVGWHRLPVSHCSRTPNQLAPHMHTWLRR